MKEQKNAEQAFVCAECEKGFKTPRALTQHSRIIHHGGKAFGYPPADKTDPSGTDSESSVMGPVVGVCGKCGSTDIVLRRLKSGETITSDEELNEKGLPEEEAPVLPVVKSAWFLRVDGTDYDFKVSDGEVDFEHVYFPSGTVCRLGVGERFRIVGSENIFEAHTPPRKVESPEEPDPKEDGKAEEE